MKICRFILAMRAQPLKLPAGGLVVIAPHPDDETIGCGGLIVQSTREKRCVVLVFLTAGEASHPNHSIYSAEDIGMQRQTEAIKAARQLGVPPKNVLFCGLPDSKLNSVPPHEWSRLGRVLKHIVSKHAVSTVLIPHRNDGSSEHEAAHRETIRLLSVFGKSIRVLEYVVWAAYSPRLLVTLAVSPDTVYRSHYAPGTIPKRNALNAYVSQFAPTRPWPDPVQPHDFIQTVLSPAEFFWERTD